MVSTLPGMEKEKKVGSMPALGAVFHIFIPSMTILLVVLGQVLAYYFSLGNVTEWDIRL